MKLVGAASLVMLGRSLQRYHFRMLCGFHNETARATRTSRHRASRLVSYRKQLSVAFVADTSMLERGLPLLLACSSIHSNPLPRRNPG
jgi:hypothetical protein